MFLRFYESFIILKFYQNTGKFPQYGNTRKQSFIILTPGVNAIKLVNLSNFYWFGTQF